MDMRSESCGECGDHFVWDNEAGSAVCPSCGTLQDSSQVVLDAHIEHEDSAKERDTFSFYHRTTLKTFRNVHGWDLAGQGTQPAAERNKIVMRELIAALVRRIGRPSLSNRTLFLFELAMERGHFRYGRKARLVAGASLVIALRENQRGETIKDIAYFLNESHVALARVFKAVASLLEVKLVSVDPSWHLPTLQKHLAEMLARTPSVLPSNLVKVLKGVHLPSAFQTAVSLSELASRAGIAVSLPSPPTACAIYILALEAEVLNSLPQCGELARALGRRFDVSKEVIMRRYRSIYEQIEAWTREIPWMGAQKTPITTKSPSNVARRVGIARHLKDAVQYQESLWKARLEATGPLTAPYENVSSFGFRVVSEIDLEKNNEATGSRSSRSRKRRRTGKIDDVSYFLLSPLRAEPSEKPHIDRVAPLGSVSNILTSETASFRQPPTRLQLLSSAKPVEEITDEELFGEGELDNFLRTAEEVDILIQTCDWAREKDADGESDTGEARAGRAGKSKIDCHSASRMSIEALACLSNEQVLSNWAQNPDSDDDNDDRWASSSYSRQIMTQTEGHDQREESLETSDDSQNAASSNDDDDDCEVIGPWMPLSPDNG